MSDSHPIACDLTSLTAEERERHSELAQSLRAAVSGVREIADGYEVTLAPDSAIVRRLSTFVGFENRCCPFLEFIVTRDDDLTVVSITGGDGIKEFLKTEYGL